MGGSAVGGGGRGAGSDGDGAAAECWAPWPDLTREHRPVLVVPFDRGRPVLAADGWTGSDRWVEPRRSPAGPVRWFAVLDGPRLTVRRPGGVLWFDGPVAATREWRRAVRHWQCLTLLTGPFRSPFELAAAPGRSLRLVAATARLAVPGPPLRAALPGPPPGGISPGGRW
ncbi:hypothetical protein [Kitasatospora sp. NPDC088134]|uniref:hypothetical protein n=1 Tax=Kitasatospora sp. NPDC088134 TaxID=3364071 RepID=UPI00380B51D3